LTEPVVYPQAPQQYPAQYPNYTPQ